MNAPYPRRYAYNKSGCILSALEEGVGLPPMYYQYYQGTNRVKSLDGYVQQPYYAITYSPSGSVTGYTSHGLTIGYDYHEQMNRMERPAGTRPSDRNGVDYWYNTAGKRIAKQYTYWYSYPCSDTGEVEPPEPLLMEGDVPEGGLEVTGMIGEDSFLGSDSQVIAGSMKMGGGEVQMSSTTPLPGEDELSCYTTNTTRAGYY